ncbi:2-C-methyl-D-erythritol 4-phosphate cytidylyltransferase [Blochmannia endosymbiont of Camponotus sp. C-003]|uniref:2-C-methyl-D-erythritol 4-phosphate cytidylyltransferase n=1 Tax=unclassified Candidatus Blochmanniella TaxID=711328 RepID=UPI002023D952|nr:MULTISPECIES: 2-C-methyl-D-erythritol 4-phosphate cytidylyltransferase [unclassified Candidatus Blochmannia]URJ23078.1 2-C-methyl-D-erythritol 4-phosphate cytidylyltransferase [Blochmannia endosymbiont of Camponotus sp. C-003]URJ28545.1 2-C-methyl-D-erythritol 4-phosphate cytidylyltransferase [Blochmannia endosymbiont of Camponotus sp. C-046]
MLKKKFPYITAILPAAGTGKRMNSLLPKQYCTIGNKTLIEYSINALLCQSCIRHCIVVINAQDRWFHQLSISYDPRVSVVVGGHTRADSVMAGLRHVKKKSVWVIVHDAVRPCLHHEDLIRLFEITKFSQVGGILAIPIFNTIKRSYYGTNFIKYTVNRENLWHALTPQLFNYDLLKYCLKKALKNRVTVTDEASAIEYCGYKSILIQGRSDNIKVTHQDDLKLANFYLSKSYKKT